MSKSLGKYTVKSYLFDGGCWMPDPEEHKPEHRFEADNEREARRKAAKHMLSFREIYFSPTPSLDSLLEIKDVEISGD